MKRRDIEPEESALRKFLQNDEIGRRADLIHLLKTLHAIEGPYSVFLDGQWGSGKTFLVKQAELVLAATCPQNVGSEALDESVENVLAECAWDQDSETGSYLPVYFSAWENDHAGDPLCALLATMSAGCPYVKLSYPTSVQDVACEAISLAASFVGVSFDAKQFADSVTGKKMLDDYNDRLALRGKINELITEMRKETADKVVLFIDELDRCRPQFALKLLEEMKRLFQRDDVIVVYSSDTAQLAKALQGVYGTEFDSLRYLDRFCDLKISLSEVDPMSYLQVLGYSDYPSHRYTQACKNYFSQYDLTYEI